MNTLPVAMPPNLKFAEVDKLLQVMLQWSINSHIDLRWYQIQLTSVA